MNKSAKASIQGPSHRRSDPPIPCQDAGFSGTLPNGMVAIVVSDGAGSSRLSHLASELCVNTLFSVLQRTDLDTYLHAPLDGKALEAQWHRDAQALFDHTRTSLLELAARECATPQELHCTLVLVLRTAWGFLSANIGDGRAGYHDGAPHALTVPFMTFTAGATYFLAKEGWERIFRSYVTVPAHPGDVAYFFASTDGPQDYLMDGSSKGPRNGVYDDVLGGEAFYDLNRPYHPFFEGLIRSLNEVATDAERDLRLARLIGEGIYALDDGERVLATLIDPALDDDKTLILHYR
jgi:hypothetical protein